MFPLKDAIFKRKAVIDGTGGWHLVEWLVRRILTGPDQLTVRKQLVTN
jgi:hypothetical protein